MWVPAQRLAFASVGSDMLSRTQGWWRTADLHARMHSSQPTAFYLSLLPVTFVR